MAKMVVTTVRMIIRTPDFIWGVVWVLVFGFWCLGFGVWVLVFGFWCLGFGVWVLVFGFWCLGSGVWKELCFFFEFCFCCFYFFVL